MTDVSGELNEIVFHSYVSGPSEILPPAAYLTDLPDQGIVQVEQLISPLCPVFSVCTL